MLSAFLAQTTGEPLSAAPLVPSILMFLAYIACLFLPGAGWRRAYRWSMVVALVLFGGGGVVGNLVRYFETGLEFYASMPAFVLAVAINLYGTILNLIAALGLYKQPVVE